VFWKVSTSLIFLFCKDIPGDKVVWKSFGVDEVELAIEKLLSTFILGGVLFSAFPVEIVVVIEDMDKLELLLLEILFKILFSL